MIQGEAFSWDDGTWLESMANDTKIQLGGMGNNVDWFVFHGSISCFQLYNKAMTDAEIITKRDCPDIAQSSKSSPCPTGYKIYQTKCIKVI